MRLSADLAERGAAAALDVLELGFGIERATVEKALDPTNRADFLLIVDRLSRALNGAVAGEESRAVAAALRELDVDWLNLTSEARARVLDAASQALHRPLIARVMPLVEERFQIAGPGVAQAARQGAITRFGLRIGTALSQRDVAAERSLRITMGNFIRDEYGRRVEHLSEVARETVARGLESGLGSEEIAAELAGALGGRVTHGRSYWSMIATSYANRARTFSQLSAYRDAGIREYVFEAVMDEVTSEQCRFYHGQVFPVQQSAAVMDQVTSLEDPEAIRDVNPWIRSGRDEEGNRVLWIPGSGDSRQVVAQIDRAGLGQRDVRGSYSREMSPAELVGAGIPFPPLHGRCRSNIVPRV